MDQLTELRETINRLFKQYIKNENDRTKYKKLEEQVKATNPKSQKIEAKKVLALQEISAYNKLVASYKECKQGLPVSKDRLYTELLNSSKLFSLKFNKQENLDRYDNLLRSGNMITNSSTEREDFLQFAANVRAHCERRLEDLEQEAIVAFENGIEAISKLGGV